VGLKRSHLGGRRWDRGEALRTGVDGSEPQDQPECWSWSTAAAGGGAAEGGAAGSGAAEGRAAGSGAAGGDAAVAGGAAGGGPPAADSARFGLEGALGG
jgi:hypothetical protein